MAQECWWPLPKQKDRIRLYRKARPNLGLVSRFKEPITQGIDDIKVVVMHQVGVMVNQVVISHPAKASYSEQGVLFGKVRDPVEGLVEEKIEAGTRERQPDHIG